MTRIDIHEANDHFLELMERIAKGGEVIIEQNDLPVARISPVPTAKKPRQSGSAKGLIHMADDFDEPLQDFADYTAGG
jgi:antitoxin (DNA-binding transcriptional repressor) of toxin-antitoxin stability system